MAKEIEKRRGERRSLIPWRPFGEMPRWEREMDRMFGDFFKGRLPSLWEEPWRGLGIREPAVDLYEEDDELVVKAELPGMTKNDIDVNVTGKVLTLRGEKKKEEEKKEKDYYQSELVYGAFVRHLNLPTEINPEKAQATFKNGVLEIRLPKSEEAKKKQIRVNVE
jgi:HSP20 family protein